MNTSEYDYRVANIKAQAVLFAHRICKLFGFQIFYESRCGIKVLNRMEDIVSNVSQTIKVNPLSVFFFADGLNDTYTLTGNTISKSPHYFLIKGILEKTESLSHDYFIRESKGALDGRFPLVINATTEEMHKQSTYRNFEFLEKNKYTHPKITCFRGGYYALDGKHRLAMAAYLGKDVICDVVSLKDVLFSNYIRGIYHKMSNYPDKYSKNLELLSSMIASVTE